jgi:hypothetical protein
MIIYDIYMHLDSFNTTINDGLNTTTFNTNTQKVTHIIYVRVITIRFFTFLNNLQIIIQHSLGHY